MSRALTATQKRRIGKLFEKYFDDWMVFDDDEQKCFLELPPEVILTVGDVLNIVKNGQSIDVIEPQSYNTISTLTPNSSKFEDFSDRDPLGYFYVDYRTAVTKI